MLLATQIDPMTEHRHWVLLALLLITLFHHRLRGLGIGTPWRVTLAIVLTMAMVLTFDDFDHRYRSFLNYRYHLRMLTVLVGIYWLGLIFIRWEPVRYWLTRHEYIHLALFLVGFAAVSSAACWFSEGRVRDLCRAFTIWQTWIVFSLPTLIAERAVHIPRWSSSRVGSFVAKTSLFVLCGLLVADVGLPILWKQSYPVWERIWFMHHRLEQVSLWIVTGVAVLFPSRFVIPCAAVACHWCLSETPF